MIGMAEPKKKKHKPGRRPDPESKRQQGIDRHTQPRKAFHGPPELFAALDRYRAEAKPRPSDSECIRTGLEMFLESKGYWPPDAEDA